MSAWLYMMTNRRNGILYVGTTVNMARRAWEHREGVIDGFTKKYDLKLLVYVGGASDPSCSPTTRDEHEALAAKMESSTDPS